MKFTLTAIKGAYIIEPELLEDQRGWFARFWCSKELKHFHLDDSVKQGNLSFNYKKGTIRGMHYQLPPNEESKLVRCISGKIYDVIIDIRKKSPTYCKWIGVELSGENRKMLYVPEGCAHGYQTIVNNTEVMYMVSEYYSPHVERGIRWNDPMFNIKWPLPVSVISGKDKEHPAFKS